MSAVLPALAVEARRIDIAAARAIFCEPAAFFLLARPHPNAAVGAFRGPVRFYDGRKGMARQDYECVAEPRFGYSWQRENRQDKGRQFYTVDGPRGRRF